MTLADRCLRRAPRREHTRLNQFSRLIDSQVIIIGYAARNYGDFSARPHRGLYLISDSSCFNFMIGHFSHSSKKCHPLHELIRESPSSEERGLIDCGGSPKAWQKVCSSCLERMLRAFLSPLGGRPILAKTPQPLLVYRPAGAAHSRETTLCLLSRLRSTMN